jgi:hypothetical protein
MIKLTHTGLLPVAAVALLAGCATVTPTKETAEGYKIYDIQSPTNSALTVRLSANLKEVLQKNAKDVQVNNAIPPATLPEKPPRFELTNPFKNSPGLQALAGKQVTMTIPSCEGAVVEATSHNPFAGAENTTFFVCLMPSQKGYHLDVYYRFNKSSGGMSTKALGQALAQSVMGDSSQFIPRILLALEDAVKASGAQPVLIESYPN